MIRDFWGGTSAPASPALVNDMNYHEFQLPDIVHAQKPPFEGLASNEIVHGNPKRSLRAGKSTNQRMLTQSISSLAIISLSNRSST